MAPDFDDMEKAELEPYWANFKPDGGYTLQEDDEVVAEHDEPLVGVLQGIERGVGENDSRIYTVRTKDLDRPIKFWGKTHINSQVDSAGIGAGTEIGVKNTGDTRDTGNDNAMQMFDVRYL